MPKAASPIRLEKHLMEAATLASSTLQRSASQQIEYWANLGRRVAKVISPDDLLAINAGLVKVSLAEVASVELDPDDVFAKLERESVSGALTEALLSNTVRYQASPQHLGMIEQVQPDGTITPGNFNAGIFTPVNERQ